MGRRDTILIAALLNAGLLVVLFTTALKTDKAAREVAENHPPLRIESLPQVVMRKEPIQRAPGDEVDQVLRDVARAPAQQVATPPLASPPVQPTLVDEINALSFAEPDPTPPPTPLAKHASIPTGSVDVIVKKGDVLEKIARTHHTTVDQIMKQNQLTTTQLKIGQVLKVHPNTAGAKVAVKEPTPYAGSQEKFYTVKNGDNPWTIAVKNHMKVDELLKLNGLDDEKARRLKPGDQLRIR